MLLAIDCGNTNTLFAVHDGTDWRAQWRTATYTPRTADEYAVWLAQLMSLQGLSFEDLSACVISSVVPQSLFNLRNLARRYLKAEPLVIGDAGVNLGITVNLDRPGEAGADRLVNALGCRVKYPGHLIIVDSGTATTFDVVSSDGAFEGGIIAPGINLSMQALHNAAAQLPRIAIEKPPSVIGKNTVGAMQSGVFWGYIDLIDGLVTRIRAEYGQPMTVIATGGVASLFEGASARIDHFDADVTIRGLLEVWRLNSAAKGARA
ncbi:MAG: type III pantothenate kinase [Oceanicaulis sp.]|uniref:type III pantothenate kinase n=1 Tax=Glycocaulis sp. TaxID=1969725 RepID=UPI0025C07B6C|nr:type III pantothenate kinase [Glycocaulis sp.]MCC5982450.1 type III pantothenate kinase [Oceanicaulis sp.]MCH8521359.1 type III pantothenate kinase [Glycocaulis sp.]